ncbi:MAG: acetate--CoA ligase family protein, partial [candidate division Zixibacteria bacterium]
REQKQKAIVSEEAIEILKAYGIPAAGYKYAWSQEEAVVAAKKTGYPVVMKINTPLLLHKTEAGGVRVDLRNADEIKKSFEKLHSRIDKLNKGEKFSVAIQKMVKHGVETVIGMTTDPQFGPLLMFGLGGIYVEIMKDVSFRINPLSTQDAKEMVRSLRSYPLLTGFRGAKPVQIATIEEVLLRLSQLVRDFDCFREIDINPFIASPITNNCKAVDARFILNV